FQVQRVRPADPTMPTRKATGWRMVLALAGALACAASVQGVALGEEVGADLAARLTPVQRKVYDTHRPARIQFDRQLRAYWHSVDAKRELRRVKHIMGQSYTAEDYIAQQPPKYTGPELPPDIAKIVTEVKPSVPETPLPGVADFLANAKA